MKGVYSSRTVFASIESLAGGSLGAGEYGEHGVIVACSEGYAFGERELPLTSTYGRPMDHQT